MEVGTGSEKKCALVHQRYCLQRPDDTEGGIHLAVQNRSVLAKTGHAV